jgi:ketosteroid isomerase-like protein
MLLSSIRERAEAGARLERVELFGTAGARVAVQRVLWGGGDSEDRFEMEFLVAQQVDEAGRLAMTINFDVDDARAAQREMWALWAAIEPHVVAFTTPLGELIDAFNAGDRDRWRAQFADGFVIDDQRRTGFGRLEGAEAYVDSVAALWELAPETQVQAGHWLAYNSHGAIAHVRRTGVIPDGGDFESDNLSLLMVSGGRITRVELFEVAASDKALARFAELCAGLAHSLEP